MISRQDDEYDEYFYDDLPECDVVVEPGGRAWRDANGKTQTERIIVAMANTDKGVTFLTAYYRAQDDDDDESEDFEIESGSFDPKELDSLKRQANLAGIALVWRGR